MNNNQLQQYINRISKGIKEYTRKYKIIEKEYVENYQKYFTEYQTFIQSGGRRFMPARAYPSVYNNHLPYEDVNNVKDQVKWLEQKHELVKKNYQSIEKDNKNLKTEWRTLKVKNKVLEDAAKYNMSGGSVSNHKIGELFEKIDRDGGTVSKEAINKMFSKNSVQTGGADDEFLIITVGENDTDAFWDAFKKPINVYGTEFNILDSIDQLIEDIKDRENKDPKPDSAMSKYLRNTDAFLNELKNNYFNKDKNPNVKDLETLQTHKNTIKLQLQIQKALNNFTK